MPLWQIHRNDFRGVDRISTVLVIRLNHNINPRLILWFKRITRTVEIQSTPLKSLQCICQSGVMIAWFFSDSNHYFLIYWIMHTSLTKYCICLSIPIFFPLCRTYVLVLVRANANFKYLKNELKLEGSLHQPEFRTQTASLYHIIFIQQIGTV